jgi:hypothetical protein
MILGLLWMGVANAAALLGAHEILLRVRPERQPFDVVLFLVLRLLLISAAVVFAGLTGGLTPWGLGFLGLAGLGFLTVRGAHRRIPRFALPPVGPVLLTLAGILLLRLAFQVWFFSPHLLDALSYHLPKVAEWVRAGAFTRELGLDSHASFPAGFELVETWWVVFLRHDVLIEMAGVEFLVLAFAAANSLAQHIGLDRRWAFFAAILTALTPGLSLQAVSCLNDGPIAALWLATAALITARAPTLTLLIPIGLGLGIKPSFAYALPGLALLHHLLRRESPSKATHARELAALAFTALGVGAFWYVRNALWFGNPLHPVGSHGLVGEEGNLQIQFGPRLGSLLGNLSDLADQRIYDRESAYGPLLTRIAGWGGVAFSVGAVGLLTELSRSTPLRRLGAAFALSLACVLLMVNRDDWSLRHALFFPALLCLGAAALASRSRTALGIAAVALAAQFLGTLLPASLSPAHFQGLVRQSWRERSVSPVYEAEMSGPSVACLASQHGASYLLYGPDFARPVLYLRVSSARELLETMRRYDVRSLYAAPTLPLQIRILEEAVASGRLIPGGGMIYRLK